MEEGVRGKQGFLATQDSTIFAPQLLCRPAKESGSPSPKEAYDVSAHTPTVLRVPTLPSTFSKLIGYILNPGSFSGLGSMALSSCRRLSSV